MGNYHLDRVLKGTNFYQHDSGNFHIYHNPSLWAVGNVINGNNVVMIANASFNTCAYNSSFSWSYG